MNIDMVYLKDLSLLLLPLLISGGAWLFLRWLKGYDSRRRCQFDRVSDVKRLSVLMRIQKLQEGPQNGMTSLQTKTLYESIGIRLPVWVAHQLVDYLGRGSVALNDLVLNSFLRCTFLTSSINGVFTLDTRKLLRQYVSRFVFLIISASAIAYGFYISVRPPLEKSETNTLLSLFFFVAYLILAFFIVIWTTNEWKNLWRAKVFWLGWKPHLCQNEAEYQVRCRLERNVTVQEKAPDTALETVADLSPTEKPLRGWLMRRLGKKNN
ncbi:hypothetical protein [Serratia ureilytica]|uniref:hypothetical protein n=1 Tax=Serratia ureilytica TaxID=300181 RepID=UPI003B285040